MSPSAVPMTPEFQQIVNYFAGKGPRPSQVETEKGLERLVQSVRLENNIYHKEVIDALFQR